MSNDQCFPRELKILELVNHISSHLVVETGNLEKHWGENTKDLYFSPYKLLFNYICSPSCLFNIWNIVLWNAKEKKFSTILDFITCVFVFLSSSSVAIKVTTHFSKKPSQASSTTIPPFPKKSEDYLVRYKLLDQRGRMKKIQHISQHWNRK